MAVLEVTTLEASDALVADIDKLCRLDPQCLADGESIQLLHRQLDRLTALTTRAVAAFDAGGAWDADGARRASAWISVRCHLPVTTARRRVLLGRSLRHMDLVTQAWLAGDISEGHVGLFASARTPPTQRCFERDEALLVSQATELRFGQFARALAYWSQQADPDGADRTAQDHHDQRSLKLSQSFGGCWVLDGLLDPINGSIVAGVLKGIEEGFFAADWAEAKARVGPGVCNADLARTPTQRRADALVEMARRSLAMPAGSRMPEPLFSVFVGYETFSGRICQLANGTVVAPGAVVDWLDQAWVERVVFDGASRVTDVGVRRRIFTGATRRGVELRDQTCFHELCDEVAQDCEIDHVQPWSAGGPTTQDNGRAACAFHNRQRHRSRPPP